MNIIAYILFALQVLSIVGGISENGPDFLIYMLVGRGFAYTLGYFSPTILGCVLLSKHGKNKRKKQTVTNKVLKENPGIAFWTCSKCKSRNYMDKHICPVCGVTKQWSDAQGEGKNAPAPKAPEEKIPEVKLPEEMIPEVRVPEVRIPEVKAPEVNVPATDAGEVWEAGTVMLGSEFMAEMAPRDPEPVISLTLYIPSVDREVTKSGEYFAAGRDPKCDLCLGDLPNAPYIARLQASFSFRDGSWFIRDGGSTNGTWLNGRRLEAFVASPLAEGDEIIFAEKEILQVRSCGAKKGELNQNIQLYFQSISLADGHVGCETLYVAEKRLVVFRKWGKTSHGEEDPTPEYLPIPETVTTEAALRQYVRQHKSWPMY